MVETTVDKDQLINELIDILNPQGSEEWVSLADQLRTAKKALDRKKARRYFQVLLEHLEESPASPRELEAMVLLGLAFPGQAGEQGIPLIQEARRLALTLEHQDKVARATALLEFLAMLFPEDRNIDKDLASLLRRTGNASRLVERYLGRAEELVQAGRSGEAIPWLQEVLLLDRTRRDVARMIRDLRYEEAAETTREQHNLKRYLIGLAILGLVAVIAWREWTLHENYQAIKEQRTDLQGLQARLSDVDALLQGNPLWLGAFRAVNERNGLLDQMRFLEGREQRHVETEKRQVAAQSDLAESARLKGRLAASQNNFEDALAYFQEALQFSEENWEHRERVQKDIDAILKWQEESQR